MSIFKQGQIWEGTDGVKRTVLIADGDPAHPNFVLLGFNESKPGYYGWPTEGHIFSRMEEECLARNLLPQFSLAYWVNKDDSQVFYLQLESNRKKISLVPLRK